MKKSIKTLFILIGLSLFTFIGINTVKADNGASVTNINIVCEPSSIEKGDKTFCYIIGKVTNDSSGAGVHGLLTKVTTSHLTITDYKAGDGSTKYVAETITNGQKFTAATPASNYTCQTQGEPCYGFFTVGASNAGLFKNTGKTGITAIDAKYTGHTSFGYFEVELDETATTKECGKLCVFSDYVSTGAGYSSPVHIAEQAQCAEIKPKASVDAPITGSFASITILIAGGLIAIGAIAIAKKNNKIYRV